MQLQHKMLDTITDELNINLTDVIILVMGNPIILYLWKVSSAAEYFKFFFFFFAVYPVK